MQELPFLCSPPRVCTVRNNMISTAAKHIPFLKIFICPIYVHNNQLICIFEIFLDHITNSRFHSNKEKLRIFNKFLHLFNRIKVILLINCSAKLNKVSSTNMKCYTVSFSCLFHEFILKIINRNKLLFYFFLVLVKVTIAFKITFYI